MASYKVEEVESSPISVLGEGPHWSVEQQCLYYNDIYGDKQSISRYDFKEDKTYNAVIPGHPVISFIIPVEGKKDRFIVGSGKKVVEIQWDGKSDQAKAVSVVGEVESNLPMNRFNDAKCDPTGRFFGGTMRIGKTKPSGSCHEPSKNSKQFLNSPQSLTLTFSRSGWAHFIASPARKSRLCR